MKTFSVNVLGAVKPFSQPEYSLLYCDRKRWLALVDGALRIV